MGRQALITLDHVRAAIAALRADGKHVSSRAVREKLGNVGSMGTINKLLHQCLGEKDDVPDSLRQLPQELQHAILSFADQQADDARRQIGEELVRCRQELTDLANDNEQLTMSVEDLREQLACAGTERATAEGREAQLTSELAGAREETAVERLAAESARVELVKLQLRLVAFAPLEVSVREVRAQWELERTARARAEQTAAVLDAQKLALENQVQELKGALEAARVVSDKCEKRIGDLSELLDKEREARIIAERESAVAAVTFSARPRTRKMAQ